MKSSCWIAVSVLATASPLASAESFSTFPTQDNTLYQSVDGGVSNGAGSSIFAGVTNTGDLRRAVLQFDLSALPPTAIITSASLRITQDRNGPGGLPTLNLHSLTSSWGEGTSVGSGGGGLSATGDATWIHRFYAGTQWTTAGGDFSAALLSSVAASGAGNQLFGSTSNFVSAVQSWIATPAQNFGIIIKEQPGTLAGAAGRFYSRETTDALSRPQLMLGFDRLVTSWNADANGTWNDTPNWSSGVPNSFGVVARFGNAIASPRTVTQSTSHTVGQIQFDSAHAYTITGAGQLNLDNGTDVTARLDVVQGSHRIESTVTSARNVVVAAAPTTTLFVSDFGSTSALSKSGAGTLRLGTASVASVDIAEGKIAITSGVAASVSSLSIAPGAVLDLDHGGVVQQTLPTDLDTQAATRNADIIAGRITSTTAGLTVGLARTTDLPISTFMGRTVPASAVLFRATFAGDGNLDATVNFDDLLALAQRYGQAIGARWVDGDSNRDGKVDFDDLLALAQKYGSTLTLDGRVMVDSTVQQSFAADWQFALSTVPEPTIALASFVVLPCLRRRR